MMMKSAIYVVKDKHDWLLDDRQLIGPTIFSVSLHPSLLIQIFVVDMKTIVHNMIECIMTVQCHPMSLISVPIGSEYATTYSLLVINNYVNPILHRFGDTARLKGRKSPFCTYMPRSHLHPRSRRRASRRWSNSWSYSFVYLASVSECDRRTSRS